MSDVSEGDIDDDDVIFAGETKSPNAEPLAQTVHTALLGNNMRYRKNRETVNKAITDMAKEQKGATKRTARKSVPEVPKDAQNGKYIPLDSTSPSPPTNCKFVSKDPPPDTDSGDESAEANRFGERILNKTIAKTTANRNRLDELCCASESENRNATPVSEAAPQRALTKAPPASAEGNKAGSFKKKADRPLPMHPFAVQAQQAGALGRNATVASFLTFALSAIHAAAADHLIAGSPIVSSSIVWKTADKYTIYRNLSKKELNKIRVNPHSPNKKKEKKEETTDEEESDD